MSSTIEMLNSGRHALRAHPAMLDAFIMKLSIAARVPAMMFRDLMLSDVHDLAAIHTISKLVQISEGLAKDVLKEYETYKHEVARIIFVPTVHSTFT
ncbi:hypothetical protein PRIPAC_97327 [Pristionchus pacificus]|uniref:Uncharacterized protein n=1 Tax=Pristionchus pacificus TaxID=54126 RepID=A0A454XYG4_PRIPA|nr:hypothetical protein PRIPAC_97327 [Pristionchus pacificus]|eukprot:PDM84565.1 hypothetical protein PRIPAC_33588 [Pristionchus pacificus]